MNKKEISINKLRAYLDLKCLSVADFHRESRIPYNLLHAVASGYRKPSRKTANLLVRATKGEITLQDFGYQ